MKSIDVDKLLQDPMMVSLESACANAASVDEAIRSYNTTLTAILDKFAPEKKRLITVHPNTHWYNKDIAQAKLLRRQLERRWRKSPLEIHRQLYLKQKQHVQSLIRKAKTACLSKQVEDCGTDTKQLFKVANKLLNRKQSSSLPGDGTDEEIANCFNQFFVDKIAKIRSSLPVIQPNVSAIVSSPTSLESLHPASVSEVEKIIVEAPNKTCELDPLNTDLIKKCKSVTAPAITAMINTSFRMGDVPCELKTAVIRPTLKKPNLDKESFKNYRPISNLPFVSKVMERVSFSRLLNYLRTNNLLDNHQSAYRPDHSVETLLADLANYILREMDAGNTTVVVLLDMSSAFDTVDHPILIHTLQHLGVTGSALKWFKSYLSDRSQYVKINGTTSASTPLTYGVPQGSVGGPLLFSLYLSPITQIFQKHNIQYHCYADDIQLYLSFPPSKTELATAINKLESCIDELKSWMESNGLKLNDSKSEFLVVGSQQMLSKVGSETCKIRIGQSSVSPSKTVRNLGVMFDANMS